MMGIQFTERQLEEYLCENLDRVAPEMELLGNQVQVLTGVADILATIGDELWVIEIKTTKLDDAALGQLLRYIGGSKFALAKICIGAYRTMTGQVEEDDWPGDYPPEGLMERWGGRSEISGLLIGPSIDQSLWIACRFIGVHVLLYEFSFEGLTFSDPRDVLDIKKPALGQGSVEPLVIYMLKHMNLPLDEIKQRITPME